MYCKTTGNTLHFNALMTKLDIILSLILCSGQEENISDKQSPKLKIHTKLLSDLHREVTMCVCMCLCVCVHVLVCLHFSQGGVWWQWLISSLFFPRCFCFKLFYIFLNTICLTALFFLNCSSISHLFFCSPCYHLAYKAVITQGLVIAHCLHIFDHK